MVEFISPNDVSEEETEEPEEPEETEEEEQKSLENLVEEQTEELETNEEQDEHEEQSYVDEPATETGDYMHPDAELLKEAPTVRETIKPLVYDENDIPVVSDVFTRYGKKEDKWWLENVNAGVLK